VDASALNELAAAPQIKQPYLPLRKVVAVGVGNALEFYDFITFSFFAIQIGHCSMSPLFRVAVRVRV
jgi:hypothetical protein